LHSLREFQQAGSSYRVTTEEIGTPVIQTVFKFSTQALSPYYKIITDMIHDYSTVAEFSSEDFAVPCIPESPENRKKNEWPQPIIQHGRGRKAPDLFI
jgi:hypothetical protein